MKLKYLTICIIFMILAIGISSVAAEETTVAGHRFTVPEGYMITQKNVSQVYMGNDSDHALLVAVPTDFKGIPEFKYQLSQAGYDIINYEGENFTQSGFDINSYNFTKDSFVGVIYFAQKNDNMFMFTYACPENEEIDLEPLNQVLESLEAWFKN